MFSNSFNPNLNPNNPNNPNNLNEKYKKKKGQSGDVVIGFMK